MCFYIFSEDGDIRIQNMDETIFIHPNFYIKPNGRSIILIDCTIEALSDDINSAIILYPNLINGVSDLSECKEILNETDEKIAKCSLFYEGNINHIEVLNRIPFEILRVTFNRLESGDTVRILMQIDSHKASKFQNDFHSYSINFDISGPDNVKRTFEQALVGAEKQFSKRKKESDNLNEKEGYSKLLSAIGDMNKNIIEPLNKSKISINSWKIVLLADPNLRDMEIEYSDNLDEITEYGTPNYGWPFKKFLDKIHDIVFYDKEPKIASFVYNGIKQDPSLGVVEHKFNIKGNAYLNKPTGLYIAVIAFLLALYEVLT